MSWTEVLFVLWCIISPAAGSFYGYKAGYKTRKHEEDNMRVIRNLYSRPDRNKNES